MQLNFNQQINFFGEIQGFDNLENLSEEVRGSAIQYLEREQSARLQYVASDQRNSHILQQKGQQFSTSVQVYSMALASVVFLSSLIIAAYLLTHGQTAAAVALVFAEIATVVGALIFGHKVQKREKKEKEAKSQEEGSTDP